MNTKHVTSLEIAKQLTEAGIVIESEAGDLYLESDDENYQRALTDIIENVVKPLYGKE